MMAKVLPIEPNLLGLIHPFQQLIAQDYPYVAKLEAQLTSEEALKLEKQYGQQTVIEVFDAMENCKNLLKKYRSVYLTANNWCKRRKNDGSQIISPALSRPSGYVQFKECQYCHELFGSLLSHEPICNKNPKNKVGELPPEVSEAANALAESVRMSCPSCGRAKNNPTKLCKDKFHDA